ncbi:MAG: protein-L-isoaspartate(D-aspartate) O-methyltransferase [Sphingomonas sp.]|uniref:protein-L-isoaspartate(D-aspartate) O-methyltransferase n=1 Tax=Sphingomonas sp. TaxID=28214 RepID=UPI0017E38B3D|nr:protein-L-isoaspartate(D-aspartate) O-methyltransferase [Sphingomonas sp.]MBA3667547.1 protein-L-isoaspartate(D-aspartate) O-methyltransferase [Sphingomonas sp.]
MTDFAALRERMVARDVAARGLNNPLLLAAMRTVPREEFVAPPLAEHAYEDRPLPIEAGQTISQPYIVALTIDAAGIGAGDKVLEVGAGSGYAAAVIGQIAGKVIAIERHHELAELARDRISRLGYDNVRIVEGDGTRGFPAEAPFDAIVAAASGRHVPPALLDQLNPGGRLVMPVGSQLWSQSLVKLTKNHDGTIDREDLCVVRFVPLIGAQGFSDEGSEAGASLAQNGPD